MINRGNWKAVKAFLIYRSEMDLISPKSVRLEESWLRHLLEWAQEEPFTHAPTIIPSFPKYLLTARLDGTSKPFSSEYLRKIVRTARHFMGWLTTHKTGYKRITSSWLDTLKPPRIDQDAREHEAVTLEEIQQITEVPAQDMWEQRIRATAVFLFLSGIRVGAFVSLPIKAIDVQERTIRQWPTLGVKTKGGKQATTYLLNIPELLRVVREWDEKVREVLSGDDLWFCPLSPETGDVFTNPGIIGVHRDTRVRKDLRRWLARVNLPYHSPHKFRHGHAVYALKMAKNVADLKAVSQNLMHSNLNTTDGVYGILSGDDVGERISALGVDTVSTLDGVDADLIETLEAVLGRLREQHTPALV